MQLVMHFVNVNDHAMQLVMHFVNVNSHAMQLVMHLANVNDHAMQLVKVKESIASLEIRVYIIQTRLVCLKSPVMRINRGAGNIFYVSFVSGANKSRVAKKIVVNADIIYHSITPPPTSSEYKI